MDSLSALATFVRTAEAGNFTLAGQQLGLSSSAIGKAIARLEERLGVRLFNRNTRAITLTQEGELFLQSCRRIISEIKSIEQEFVRGKSAPEGKLRISLPMVGAFMTPVISLFMRQYPDIELDLDFCDEPSDLIGGSYDAAIQIEEPEDSRLMSRSLGTLRSVIVGSPDYLARMGVPRTAADLATHDCLHYKPAGKGKPKRWPLRSGDHEAALPTKATVTAITPLIRLVRLGHGIACLPLFTVQREIQEGCLVRILDNQIRTSETVRITWPSSRFMPPKLRVFIDFLAENLPSMISDEESNRLAECTSVSRDDEPPEAVAFWGDRLDEVA
ncbi:LysR family transcriptional regulator [Bradyrhizobium sp. U87765 SZCCT0131]|uniref:LysR family transcriptional regulator n=1 Tax=unclassified Bradyrhizobium TaxID=2631580 RepID=UPI001BAA3C0C|nr:MULTISPECIES: LysR family transcriptional regulator [unclassified Bradyrhizobium]MBR1218045.1 LysR family transcriptional regulator [Bradyrhizobium sp. U87765 SZCCT0131]MBR1261009.1 LysR family transcriptional regulator [Bradyrhizobium sp. U87765 SZCCT0134]MBR1303543.1 LysR family transcriptional regulator [Bradyrhizobium sp. U87765 SZCCT0110]MBR1319149.1 LysR family transcriptional regulator [Bradyrhizobium sp. U87765 SZCCT0109]MBR1347474.1 LysR family transcriptional regulator [Bradyrhizo